MTNRKLRIRNYHFRSVFGRLRVRFSIRRQAILRLFVVLLSSSKQMFGYFLKTGYGRFLLCHSEITNTIFHLLEIQPFKCSASSTQFTSSQLISLKSISIISSHIIFGLSGRCFRTSFPIKICVLQLELYTQPIVTSLICLPNDEKHKSRSSSIYISPAVKPGDKRIKQTYILI